jgi:hypothetical protein
VSGRRGRPPTRPQLGPESLRALPEGARIMAACLAAAMSGRPLQPGDRSGRKRDGALQVVRWLRPDGPSPWWLVVCRACKAEQEHRANRLRNYRPSCRSCGTA